MISNLFKGTCFLLATLPFLSEDVNGSPRYPMKTDRTLFTDERIDMLRKNIENSFDAENVARKIVLEADDWLEWSDKNLMFLVTPSEVPRAFALSVSGCPICEEKIFEQTGKTYPWIIDIKKPFKVECPVCNTTFPSNDYEEFYRSGFKNKENWKGPYVDDGRGWTSPSGEKFWFVAHANHWTWWSFITDDQTIKGALYNLSRAYLITGERKYAHKALVLLRKIAEEYPTMDHERQSRFGEIQADKGIRYPGRVLNAIWETDLMRNFAEAYDAVWETIDTDEELQTLYGETGKEIREAIERNLLEDGLETYFDQRIAGNYGMHQRTLLTLAVVRQHGDNMRYLKDVFDHRKGFSYLGMRYALYNLTFSDGNFHESLGYNYHQVIAYTAVLQLLPFLKNVESFDLPVERLKKIYNAPMDVIINGILTPAIGDGGSVYGHRLGQIAEYDYAFRTFQDARYQEFLRGLVKKRGSFFDTFESLMSKPPEQATSNDRSERYLTPQPSRLISGFGLSILNNQSDDVAASIYHGLHIGHFHYDRLNLDIYLDGFPMMPDLGYPDSMNDYVSGISTWTKNTVSHNTVVVDAKRQEGNDPQVVEMWASGNMARVADISAPGTYPKCSLYRRAVVMVDTDPENSYFVDFFSVSGGKQHDYILHGPPGEFIHMDGTWSEPAEGTFAGKNVAIGEIYDDPVLGKKDYEGGYNEYQGSGFQHLFNHQTLLDGEVLVEYRHKNNMRNRLRLRVLDQPKQEMFMADARVSPLNNPDILKFLIARRTHGSSGTMESLFTTVMEPYRVHPFIKTVQRMSIETATAVAVTKENGDNDLVIYDAVSTSQKKFSFSGHQVESDAKVIVLTFSEQAELKRVFFVGGSHVKVGDRLFSPTPELSGKVAKVDVINSTVWIPVHELDIDPASLAGRVIRFTRAKGAVANTIVKAERDGDTFKCQLKEDLLIGLIPVESRSGKNISTDARIPFSQTYPGATVYQIDGKNIGKVASVGKNSILVENEILPNDVEPGKDIWIGSIGSEDKFEIMSMYEWNEG